MDDYEDSIRERAGLASSGYLYRGGTMDDPDLEEMLTGGSLPGDTVTVWRVSDPPGTVADNRASAVEDALTVVEKTEVEVTGGLSSRFAGARKFATTMGEPGTTLVVAPREVTPEPTPIEYDLSWFHENPGLLARIDTLAAGEIRAADSGRLLGLTYPEGAIDTVGEDNLQFKATSSTYTEEKEWYVSGPRMGFTDQAVVGAVTLVHTQRAMGGSIQGALNDYPEFRMGFGRGETTDITSLNTAEQARELWSLHERDLLLNNRDVPLVVVVVGSARDWQSGDGIDSESVLLAFDGSQIIQEPNALPRWVPV